ncbi:MAG: hypothetical protein O3B08_17060, partial [Proteobacteria bacterium]|nr:hypothetical protein [Pseudomonadota bacterium]
RAATVGRDGTLRGARPEGRLSVDCGGVSGGGNSDDSGRADGCAPRCDRSMSGKVGSGPSLSRTLRSTMTLGRLVPGEYT